MRGDGEDAAPRGTLNAPRDGGPISPPLQCHHAAGLTAASSAGREGLEGAVGRILTPQASCWFSGRSPPGFQPHPFLRPLSGSQRADLRLGEDLLRSCSAAEFPSGLFPLCGKPSRGGPQFGGVGLFQGALACSCSPHTYATVSRHFYQSRNWYFGLRCVRFLDLSQNLFSVQMRAKSGIRGTF